MSSNTPCAACKFLRRKCTQDCVFFPYFPPDDPNKFANVHKVFGASNVSKILNDLPPNQRAEAVRSLAFEAASRIQDPIYGCVATISLLQQKLKHLNIEIDNARRELAQYIGPSALVPTAHQHHHPGMVMQQQQELQQQEQQMLQLQMGNAGSSSSNLRHHSLMMNNVNPMMGLVGPSPQLMIREPQEQQQQQHQMFDPQQLAAMAAAREQQLAAVREQELMMRNLEHQQQQHQQELFRFQNHGYDVGDSSGFSNQITVASSGATGVVSPGLTLGGFDESYGHIQPEQQQPQQQQLSQHLHHQMQAQLFLQNQLQQQPPPPLQDEEEKPLQLQQLFQQPKDRSGSDEVRRIGGGGGPSC